MKKILCMFLSLMFVLLSAVPALASETVTASAWTDELTMTYEDYNQADGPTYASAYYGLWTKDVVVDEASGQTRQYGFYTPRSWVAAGSCVYVAAPEGYTAEEFANASTWMQVADEQGITVAFLAGEDGHWQMDNLDAELAYFTAVATDLSARTIINYNESDVHLIGYGEGSTVANYATMNMSNFFASAVMMGTPVIDEATIAEVGDRGIFTSALMGDFTSQRDNMFNKEVHMPVWIVNDSEANEALEEYWLTANEAVDQGLANEYASIYNQDPLHVHQTAMYEALSSVWISEMENAATNYDYDFTTYIWTDFLSTWLRLRAQEHGTLYYNSAEQMDRLTYYSEEVDGLNRFWGVYVPESYNPDEPMPMVLFTHGHAHGITAFFVNTGLWRVAEKYGFIILYGLGRPCSHHTLVDCYEWRTSGEELEEDLAYIDMILDRTMEEYNVDASRVYNMGHSNGSALAYCIAEYMPERFAAFAPVGAGNRVYESVEDFPAADENSVKYGLLSLWGGEESGADINNSEISIKRALLADGIDMEAEPVSYYNGKYTVNTFYNEQDIPLVQHMALDNTVHTILPEFSEIVWDFFSAYSRGEDGALYYNGVLVE